MSQVANPWEYRALITAVQDVNKTLAVKPKINYVGVGQEAIAKAVVKTISENISHPDVGPRMKNLAKETRVLYNKLVDWVEGAEPEPEPNKVKEGEEAPLPECFGENYGEQDDCPACREKVECEQIHNRKDVLTGMTLRETPAETNPEHPVETAGKPKKPRKEKKKATPRTKTIRARGGNRKYTREESIVTVLKAEAGNPHTLKEWITFTNTHYKRKTGVDRPDVAQQALSRVMAQLLALGHAVKDEDGSITYTGV